jgi:hypothetical protein
MLNTNMNTCIMVITYEQLKARLGLPEYAKITLLSQQPEEVLQGEVSFILETPGLVLHDAKLRRVPIADLMTPSWGRDMK